jgi:hypothetical protein
MFGLAVTLQGAAGMADTTDSAAPSSTVAAAPAVATAPTVAVLGDVPVLNQVHIDFTPYLWLPSINGTFRYSASALTTPGGTPIIPGGTQTFDETVGPNQYLSKLNFALMGRLDMHVGPLGLYADFLNVNATSQSGSTANFSGPAGLGGFTLSRTGGSQVVTTLVSAAPTITIFHGLGTRVDFLAGGQWLTMSTNTNVQVTGPLGNTFTAGASNKSTYGEFIAGFKGQIGLADHLSLPFLVDAGLGTPTSYQFIAAVKYGNFSLGWRYLQFNAGSSTALVQRLTLGGPLLGYTIPF